MKINRTTQLLTGIAVGLAGVAIVPKPGLAGTNFYCNMNAPTGLPTVYAQTPSGGKPVMALYSQEFSGSGYTPERRCQEIAQRFTQFSATGQLNYLTTGYVNNAPVICVVSSHGMPCAGDTVLFTLKPNDPESATSKLQRLFNIRAGASDILFESEDDAGTYIDFNQFLNGITAESTTPAQNAPSMPSASPSGQPGTAW